MARFSLARRRQLTLAATILGSSLAFVDATVVFVALPTIERDLELGLTGVQWIFLAYSLSLAALYLVGGAVGDRYGRRNTFIVGVLAFALTSLLAGAAWDGGVLIAARALQGVAGAFLTTNSLALLRAVYAEEAGRAVGLWTAFTSVATVAAPALGGALVEFASWRWIFLLNLPLAALALALARLGRCDERAQLRLGRLDLPGAALAATGFGALTYGLVEGADKGFATVWWALALAVLALGAFVVVERRVAEPMLPFALFRRRNFAMANLETFFAYGATYALLVFATNVHVQFLGFSPVETGFVNIPMGLALVLLAARFGKLADRHGPRLFLALGPALMGVAALLFLPIEERADFWTWGVAGIAAFSLALAVLVAPITATALKSAPSEFAGIASGVNSTVSRLGSLLAVAVIGAVISVVYRSRADTGVPLAKAQAGEALRAASTDAFRAGMVVAVALAAAAVAVALLGIRNREPDAREEVTEAEPAAAGS
ncbi:MAG: MFS transporter [Thermoleophilia bacterium]|nr:MFS transporter [Thermoleophilia bacterium]